MRISLIFASLLAIAEGAFLKVANFGANPTNLEMNVYVPNNTTRRPAIIVAVSQFNINPFHRPEVTRYRRLQFPLHICKPMSLIPLTATLLRHIWHHPIPIHQIRLPRRQERLHCNLPDNSARNRLLGSRHPQIPHSRRRRRLIRHCQHGALRHRTVRGRPTEGLCYRRILRRHDGERHVRRLSRSVLCLLGL